MTTGHVKKHGLGETDNHDEATLTELNTLISDGDLTVLKDVTINSNTILDDTYNIVIGITNAFTITLPPAVTYYSANNTIEYTVKNDKTNTNSITLAGDGAELIDDSNTLTIPSGSAIKVISDGTKWHII